MKRIFTYILTLAAVACTDLYGPEPVPTEPVKSEGIEIAFDKNSATDDSFSFTLTPKGEALYYSYLVELRETEAPNEYTPEEIYGVEVEGAAQGTVKWTAEKPSATIKVEGLERGAAYWIYAVAGSTTGEPGDVVVSVGMTADTQKPIVKSVGFLDQERKEFIVEFDEWVYLGMSGEADAAAPSGSLSAKIYAINSDKFTSGSEAESTVTMDLADAQLGIIYGGKFIADPYQDGSGMYMKIPLDAAWPAGALYAVDMAEGTVEDMFGNAIEAVASSYTYDAEKEEATGKGVFSAVKTEAFSLPELESNVIEAPETPFTIAWSSDYAYFSTDEKAVGTVTYKGAKKTTTVDYVPGTDFTYSENRIVLPLPIAPEWEDAVTINIKAGTFTDIYGNSNAAWTADLVYGAGKGYTLDDIVGSYICSYTSAFNQKEYSDRLVIEATTEEDNDPESGIDINKYKMNTKYYT